MSKDKQSSVDKEFVPYEEALALKELGFDEPCFGYSDNKGKLHYNTNGRPVVKDWIWVDNQILPTDMVLAPTFSQAFRFFREEYNLLQNISYVLKKTGGVQWFFDIKGINMTNNNILPHSEIRFEIYEEAELECLRKLIEIVKTYGGNK